jgi:hypothetical protein
MKKWVGIVIVICIIISLIAFLGATDIKIVIDSVQGVGYKFIWLLVFTGIAYYFGTLSWKFCLGDQKTSISTGKLYLIRHVGETVSLFNPASIVVGDALKIFMLEDYGIEKKRVVASVVLSRLILIAGHLLIFLVTVLVLLIQNSSFRQADVYNKAAGAFPLILNKLNILRLKIASYLKELSSFYRPNKKALGWSVFFALLHWLVGALEFYYILRFLDIEVSIFHALFIDLGVVFFKAAGTLIPAHIGIEEYGNKIMLMAIGVPDAEIWISASILRRARQLVWLIFGIIIYFLLVKQRPKFQKK